MVSRRRFCSCLAAAAGLCTASSCMNQTFAGTLTSLSDRQIQRLPYEELGTFLSNPGESKEAFLFRLSPVLRAYSDRTGFEACAAIAATDGGHRFGIVLGSNHSHLACANDASRVPQGMTAIGQTYHSHGRAGKSFLMNLADRIFAGIPASYDGLVPVHGQRVDMFSQADFLSGPGYLAIPGGLLYQDGSEQSVRRVALADTAPSVSALSGARSRRGPSN